MTATVEPRRGVFGDLPADMVALQGDTRLPPERRIDPAASFPPDTLRLTPFWDCARDGTDQMVLVLFGPSATVRLLSGPHDNLIDAVGAIRGWTQLGPHEVGKAVLETLAATPLAPPSWNAATTLLLRSLDDRAGYLAALLALPNRSPETTDAVIAGIPREPAAAVVGVLLGAWAKAKEPPEVVAYLRWFDGNRAAWVGTGDDGRVRDLACHSQDVSGPELWREEIRRYADALAGG